MRGAVVGFLVAVLPLVVTPGASLTLLARQVGAGGRGQGPRVILGTVAGLYVHMVLAAAGLSALVMASSRAFTVLRLAGAAYLFAFGVWAWRSAGPRPRAASGSVEARPAVARLAAGTTARAVPARWRNNLLIGRSSSIQALLGTVLNPKAASIYLTLLPEFLDLGRPVFQQVVVLATAHALLIALWLLMWTVVIGRAAGALRSPRLKATVNKATGVMFIGLGLRTALW